MVFVLLPVVQAGAGAPFSDTVSPARFGTVKPFDPQIFQSIEVHARSLLAGQPDHRVSPVEVASWLDGFAAESEQALAEAGPHRTCEIHMLSDDGPAASLVLSSYREARTAWLRAAEAGDAYVPDVTFGSEPWLCGHWRDRLPALEAEVAEMARLAADTGGGGIGVTSGAASAAAQVLALPPAPKFSVA